MDVAAGSVGGREKPADAHRLPGPPGEGHSDHEPVVASLVVHPAAQVDELVHLRSGEVRDTTRGPGLHDPDQRLRDLEGGNGLYAHAGHHRELSEPGEVQGLGGEVMELGGPQDGPRQRAARDQLLLGQLRRVVPAVNTVDADDRQHHVVTHARVVTCRQQGRGHRPEELQGGPAALGAGTGHVDHRVHPLQSLGEVTDRGQVNPTGSRQHHYVMAALGGHRHPELPHHAGPARHRHPHRAPSRRRVVRHTETAAGRSIPAVEATAGQDRTATPEGAQRDQGGLSAVEYGLMVSGRSTTSLR